MFQRSQFAMMISLVDEVEDKYVINFLQDPREAITTDIGHVSVWACSRDYMAIHFHHACSMVLMKNAKLTFTSETPRINILVEVDKTYITPAYAAIQKRIAEDQALFSRLLMFVRNEGREEGKEIVQNQIKQALKI